MSSLHWLYQIQFHGAYQGLNYWNSNFSLISLSASPYEFGIHTSSIYTLIYNCLQVQSVAPLKLSYPQLLKEFEGSIYLRVWIVYNTSNARLNFLLNLSIKPLICLFYMCQSSYFCIFIKSIRITIESFSSFRRNKFDITRLGRSEPVSFYICFFPCNSIDVNNHNRNIEYIEGSVVPAMPQPRSFSQCDTVVRP